MRGQRSSCGDVPAGLTGNPINKAGQQKIAAPRPPSRSLHRKARELRDGVVEFVLRFGRYLNIAEQGRDDRENHLKLQPREHLADASDCVTRGENEIDERLKGTRKRGRHASDRGCDLVQPDDAGELADFFLLVFAKLEQKRHCR